MGVVVQHISGGWWLSFEDSCPLVRLAHCNTRMSFHLFIILWGLINPAVSLCERGRSLLVVGGGADVRRQP
jgi:hypothetical protein